ncbi:MAG: signal recognition particle-docking protein FtsY [Myxococcales bacterium]|nr:signal recognition particle-docking protein FtsY [Myxococcales bacterium]
MPPALLAVIALVVIGAIVFFVLRGRKPADETLESGEGEKAGLPPPKAGAQLSKEPASQPEKVKVGEPEKAKPSEPAKAKPAEPKAEPAKAAEPEKAKPAEPAKTPEAPAKASEPEAAKAAPVETPASEPAKASEPAVEAPAPKAAPVETPAPRAPAKAEARAPKKDVAALKTGLKSARTSWVQRLVGIFSGKKELSPELVTQIEEVLLTGDVGVSTTEKLLAVLKERLDKKDLGNEALVWQTLREVSREVIDVPSAAFGAKKGDGPLVILVVGVNGVGKTTTIGKLAARYKEQGKKVYLAAGDTFRAAAVAQLEAWGKRVGVQTIKGKDLTKPSAVVYDAVQQAAKEGADVVIADTAGRLHTKTPLMDELRKLGDAANKALPGAPHEILLVLDATTGQNAVIQVNEFKSALAVSGIVLTKLDGTAKGGVILSVCEEHKIPVRFIGVGEKVDDLREFDADEFSEALFSAAGEGEGAEGAA